MGIRFYCPHGHKLNVKVEQAGKVGICPKCGERVLIPMESTRPSSHQAKEPSERPAESDELTSPAIQNKTPFSETEFSSLEDNTAEEFSSLKEMDTSAEVFSPPVIDNPPPFVAKVDSPDHWEVLVGEQIYGPVSKEQFVRWIDEQRISPTMRARRSGWKEWKVIEEIPEIAGHFAGASFPIPRVSVPQRGEPQLSKKENEEKPDSVPFHLDQDAVFESEQKRKKQAQKRKKRNRDVGLVIGLLAAIIGLLALLLFLLAR